VPRSVPWELVEEPALSLSNGDGHFFDE
jgi:hypothetical protein